MFKSLTAWIVLQNKVFINQEQLVLAKEGVKSPCRHILLHSNTKKKKQTNSAKTSSCACFLMSIYGRTKGYITNRWRMTLKRTVRRSASLVTAVIVHCERANYSPKHIF